MHVMRGASETRPSPLRVALLLHRDLVEWLLRRPIDSSGGEVVAPSRDNAFLPLVIVTTLTLPVETLLFFVLIPGSLWWLRDLLLVLSVEATVLVWGFYASTVRRPHLLTADGIIVRWSRFTDRLVPYHAISGVVARRGRSATGQAGLTFHPREAEAFVTNGLWTNVTLELSRPARLSGFGVGERDVTRLSLDVRDPAALVVKLGRGAELARASGGISDAAEAPVDPQPTIPLGLGLSPRALVALTLALEVPLFGVGWLWMSAQGLDLAAELRPTLEGVAIGAALGLAIAAASLGSLVAASRVRALRGWRDFVLGTLGRYLGPAGLPALALLSVCAGLGEEVFFRGALQGAVGLVPTALIFGLAHVAIPKREALPVLAYIVLVGLVLGLARQSQPLFPLVVAHAVVDLVDAAYLHFAYRRASRAERPAPWEGASPSAEAGT
jgi:hypothetical protein